MTCIDDFVECAGVGNGELGGAGGGDDGVDDFEL